MLSLAGVAIGIVIAMLAMTYWLVQFYRLAHHGDHCHFHKFCIAFRRTRCYLGRQRHGKRTFLRASKSLVRC